MSIRKWWQIFKISACSGREKEKTNWKRKTKPWKRRFTAELKQVQAQKVTAERTSAEKEALGMKIFDTEEKIRKCYAVFKSYITGIGYVDIVVCFQIYV